MKIPAEIRPEDVTIIVDSREQQPWDLAPLKVATGTLCTADYALAAAPHICRVERKSLEDLLGCVTSSRERFERELERLRGFPAKAVIVEASWDDLERGDWRSQVTPQSVIGSILRWHEFAPFILAGSRDRAQKLAARMLFLAAKARYREARALLEHVTEGEA